MSAADAPAVVMVAVSLACSCGCALEDRFRPPLVNYIVEAWERIHQGCGHEPRVVVGAEVVVACR